MKPTGCFGNCRGSRVLQWLYRQPCEACNRARTGRDRLRKHSLSCRVHRVVEWFADELGAVVVDDGGFYGDGVIEFRPWRWRGGILARHWTAQFARAIRADVRDGRLPNIQPWNSV